MRFSPILFLALLGVLAAAAPAQARYAIGVGDQSAAMFTHNRWQALDLKRTRYIVPWDWYRSDAQIAETDVYLNQARLADQDVLVAFNASRGCWEDGRYSRSRSCKPPSARRYRRMIERFRERYPWVDTFSPWNEVNHASQPTVKSPRRAARYYDVLDDECGRDCTVTGADVLDSSNVRRYLRRYMRQARRYAGKTPRIWGLHNYQDVNRRRSSGTREVLDIVPGVVWLTETGGIVTFGRSWKTNERRAAKRLKYMFRLADRYDSRRRGLRSRISRLYVYHWFGSPEGARFDAGLVDPDGTYRKGYGVFRKYVRRASR